MRAHNQNVFEKSNLAKRLLAQYLLSATVYFLCLFVCAAVSDLWLSKKVWHETDTFWPFLHWVQENIICFFLIILLAGWLMITLLFVLRALFYLRRVVAASEQLASGKEDFIRLPDALKQVQDELNQVWEKSKRNRELAREAEKRKNDLLVYLAHDLKTPLTSVIGYLTLLSEEPRLPHASRERFTGIALEKAERLEGLINEFFEITRFNLSVITLERETVNLSRMMEQLASEFLPLMREKKLTWENQIEPDILVFCDTQKLERVFDNLIRNAIFYSYPHTPLTIHLAREGADVKIMMINRGKTISPEKLSRIFEQFFRLDESRATARGGAGLGLAIAKEIVELHGGTITAQSENETIYFFVTLPVSGM